MRCFCYSLLAIFLCAGAAEDALETAVAVQKNVSSDGRFILDSKNSSLPGKSIVRREQRNETITDLNPLLLFPFLPLLLPDITKSGRSSNANNRNDTEVKNSPGPVVFFDLTFDTREMPLENKTALSKINRDTEPSQLFFGNLTWKPPETKVQTAERRQPSDVSNGFPSFLGDAFSEPSFLLGDFPFLRKPGKKTNKRRTRDKHQDQKNDFKFIQDAIDDAFSETEKEFREADPFAQLFQIVDGFFSENVKREEKMGTKEKTTPNSPAIVLDEVVKIGQVHVFDDGTHKNQRKGKRGATKKSFNAYRRNRHERNAKKTHRSIDRARRGYPPSVPASDDPSSPQNESHNDVMEREPLRKHVHSKSLREDLTRNITEVLNRFLNLGQEEEFDWTEEETLDRHKKSRAKRQEMTEDFEEEYLDVDKRERQITDLNYLLLTVTLPTVLVLILLLLVCFSSFRAKGRICTKLFKPRQMYVVGETHPNPGAMAIKTGLGRPQNV